MLTHKGDGSEEDNDGASVVESEDMVVDAHRVPLVEQAGDPPEDEGEHAGTQILYLAMDVRKLKILLVCVGALLGTHPTFCSVSR